MGPALTLTNDLSLTETNANTLTQLDRWSNETHYRSIMFNKTNRSRVSAKSIFVVI